MTERKTLRALCEAVVRAERLGGCATAANVAREELRERLAVPELGETTPYTILGALHYEWDVAFSEGLDDGMCK